MNAFWKKPKKKRKSKPMPRRPLPALPEAKPESWVPLYPQKPKSVTDGGKPLIDATLTYEISTYASESAPKPEHTKIFSKNQSVKRDFLKTFHNLTRRWRAWDVWCDFITLAACTISNTVDKSHYDQREATYLKIIKKYDKQEQELFPQLFAYTVLALEEDPEQDFLGQIYMELQLGDSNRQQHFTPYSVCRVMAEISMEDLSQQIKDHGFATINDCCCGAGATLIAAANVAKVKLEADGLNFQNHILITGQDIDSVVTMMCYIQLSLLGVAGYFKVGNSLTEPMTNTDSLDNYWFTPMYFFPVWTYRRIFHQMDRLINSSNNNSGGDFDGKV